MIAKHRLYLSTVARDAAALAERFGIGLELAEFCSAANMDENFAETDALVREKVCRAPRLLFHAPFNELHPAAIDPRALTLAKERIAQAAALAQGYGAAKMIAHSGYVPLVYHKSWHTERSVLFWREMLERIPSGMTICVENVMEDEPFMPAAIAEAVGNDRLRLCLDVGHANVCRRDVPVEAWVEEFAPYFAHVHLHNNDGAGDRHAGLYDGALDIEMLMRLADDLAPEATFTIESIEAENSLERLFDSGVVG
jgi:sugar phosphate isomerase/epimerase